MKKIFAWIATASLALGIGAFALPKATQSVDNASAAGEVLFSDDFSAYSSYGSSGAGSSGSGTLNTRWANQFFDGVGDGTYDQSCTAAEVGITTLNGNKVLELKTAQTDQSFFYLTPRSSNGTPLVAKDYEVSFRFMIKNTSKMAGYVATDTAPWIATLNRKTAQQADGSYAPADGRFNGTNSIMMGLRAGLRTTDAASTSPYFYSELNRVALSSMSSPPGGYPKNEDRSDLAEDNTTATIFGVWNTYRTVVSGNECDLYLNDVHIGGFTIPSAASNKMYRQEGYISLACCVWDGYVDDFVVKAASGSGSTQSVTINASADNAEAGTVTGGGSYEAGASVTLKATAKTGYTFEGWYQGSTKLPGAGATYTFTANSSASYVAKFTPNKYTITATSSNTAGGTVTGGGSYDYNSTVSLIASEPNDGWKFDGWYKDGTQVATTRTYAVTVKGNATYEARYSANKVTVTAVAGNATAGSVSGGGQVTYGGSVTLKATTNTGYEFDGWYDGALKVSSSATWTFNATETKTYTAQWNAKKYTVTLEKNIGRVRGAGEHAYGSTVTIEAIASGYQFDGWYEGSTKVSSSTTYTFTVKGNVTYKAKWILGEGGEEVNTYDIYVSAGTAGGTVEGEGTYVENDTVTLTATTKATYRFLGWFENGTKVSSDETYTFKATASRTLVAKWEQITYTVSATAGTVGGTVSGANTYVENSTVTLKATATDETYRFLGWFEGDTKVSSTETYTFKATANRTLVAKWEQITYTISVSAEGEGGTATTISGATKVMNEIVTLTATTEDGYTFLGWYKAGTNQCLSPAATYNHKMIGDVEIVAKWMETLAIEKEVTVRLGNSAKVNFAANGRLISVSYNDSELVNKEVSYDAATGTLEFTWLYLKDLGVGTHKFYVLTDTVKCDLTVTVVGLTSISVKYTKGVADLDVTIAKDVPVLAINYVDGKQSVEVPAEMFTVKNAEGIITFDADFLAMWDAGEHKFSIVTEIGTYQLTIKISDAPTEVAIESSGCASVVGVSSAATMLGLAGVALMARKRRKK